MENITLTDDVTSTIRAGDDALSAEDKNLSEDILLYLTFILGRELFGIPVSAIREVIEYKKVFKTPRVPDYIKGVINLRGEVVPIIDLSFRFYGRKSEILETTAIVVIEVDEDNHKFPIGVMIDAVRAVAELQAGNVESTPEIGTRIRYDFLDGIGKINDEFVILLNIHNILSIGELSAMDEKIN